MHQHTKHLVLLGFFILIFFSSNTSATSVNDLLNQYKDTFQKKSGYALPSQTTLKATLSAHPQFSQVESNPNYVQTNLANLKGRTADLERIRKDVKSGVDITVLKDVIYIKQKNTGQLAAIESRAKALMASAKEDDKIKGALIYKYLASYQLKNNNLDKFLEYICYAADYDASAAGHVAILRTISKNNSADLQKIDEILELKKQLKKDPLRDLYEERERIKHQQQLQAAQQQHIIDLEQKGIRSFWEGAIYVGGPAAVIVGVVVWWIFGTPPPPPPKI